MSNRPGAAIHRVLLVLQSTEIGGMEAHCVDLAEVYNRRGIGVMVIIPEPAKFDVLEERFRAAGAAVVRLNTDAREGRGFQIGRLRRLLRRCRDWKPDVVHLHTGGATGGLGVVALARLATGAAVVVSEHDVPTVRPYMKNSLSRSIMDRLVHTLVAVSRRNAGLRRERSWLGAAPDRSAVVLNGVPAQDVPPQVRVNNRRCIRGRLGIGDDQVVLGCVARLVAGKGLDVLLRAFAIVRRARPCELLLIGDGPLREELEALARELDVDEHVHLAGQQADPAPFIDALDVFVLAVPAGTMSIALLEAMARGVCPVITFCGPEEAVIPDETGICAAPNDPQELAAALMRIAGDEHLRSRIGRAAAAHVRRNFTSQRVAEDMLAVYAGAKSRALPRRLRADSPPDPRPGEHPSSDAGGAPLTAG